MTFQDQFRIFQILPPKSLEGWIEGNLKDSLKQDPRNGVLPSMVYVGRVRK